MGWVGLAPHFYPIIMKFNLMIVIVTIKDKMIKTMNRGVGWVGATFLPQYDDSGLSPSLDDDNDNDSGATFL